MFHRVALIGAVIVLSLAQNAEAQYDGSWSGTTAQSHSITFTISGNSITALVFGFRTTTAGCSVDVVKYDGLTSSQPISGSSFSFSDTFAPFGISFTIVGTFSSQSNASGTLTVNVTAGGLFNCSGSGSTTWSATKDAGTGPPATSVTIPVAASIHGASSTFFHSDVRVFNRSMTSPVSVTAKYHCFAPPCGNSPQTFTLSPREMRVFDDMIAVTFNAAESGGAIEFSSAGSLVVTSRLYTPSRPSPTNGMGVPGVLETEAVPVAVLTSLSHSADPTKGFRSNVGAYNANDVTQMITFTLYNPAGTQIGQASASAPPRTSVQVSNVFAVAKITSDVPNAYCVVHGDQNLPLLAYAGVIDNQSQDLAFIKGENGLPP